MALTVSEIKRINKRLLAWYKANARPLKIRERSKPYEVLIVEVMAQQTSRSGSGARCWRAPEIAR